MSKTRKDFLDSPIYTVTKYIYWFLMGNVYFTLLNLPLILVLITVIANTRGALPDGFNLLILLCCLPLGPSLAALFGVMGKLVREKDISITKDFFTSYRVNLLQALLLTFLEMLAIVVLYTDIRFFIAHNYPSIITIIFYQMIAYIFILGLYALPIMSRFKIKSRRVLKLSLYYSIKKFNRTLINLGILIVFAFFLFKLTPFILIMASSIICFLIMYNEQGVLKEIEEDLLPE